MQSVHPHRRYQCSQGGAFVLLEAKAYVTLTQRNGSSACELLKVGVAETITCSLWTLTVITGEEQRRCSRVAALAVCKDFLGSI